MKQLNLAVTEGLEVTVLPNEKHEFLMTTKDVAIGYEVSLETVRSHKMLHRDELVEGKHFVRAVDIFNSGCKSGNYKTPPDNRIFWTKRGIVRLGFFIKSERARMFRDWAEDFVIMVEEQKDLFGEVIKVPQTLKRKHNRLTQDRMIDILVDVAKIEDKNLRLSLIDKLTNK